MRLTVIKRGKSVKTKSGIMVITTDDGKKWIYDEEHHEWIDVSVDNSKLQKLLDNSVKIRVKK